MKQKNITLDYTDPVPAKWDAIEVHPVKEIEPGIFEIVDNDSDADIFSVYAHDINGGIMCIADCQTYKQATDFKSLIISLVSNYNPPKQNP